MKELYYRFKLRTLLFNYSIDNKLDIIISSRLNNKIKSISYEVYDLTINFEDGTVFNFWNANKYYAWISDGNIEFEDKQKYNFKNVRPSAKTMYQLEQLLINFYKNK